MAWFEEESVKLTDVADSDQVAAHFVVVDSHHTEINWWNQFLELFGIDLDPHDDVLLELGYYEGAEDQSFVRVFDPTNYLGLGQLYTAPAEEGFKTTSKAILDAISNDADQAAVGFVLSLAGEAAVAGLASVRGKISSGTFAIADRLPDSRLSRFGRFADRNGFWFQGLDGLMRGSA